MPLRTLDIFCGGGGSSYGAQRAGATIAGGIDMWNLATETFSQNFPDAETFSHRLENVRLGTLRERVGPIDLLLASPECTNHTCAKGSAPRSEESRATAMQLIRFARALNPRWLIMENVVHMRPWSRYAELKAELQDLGYKCHEQVLDASDFGVAQKRRRLFLLCDREAAPQPVPLPRRRQRSVAEILDPPGTWKSTPLFRKTRAPDTLERAKRAFSVLGRNTPFLIVYYGTDGCGGWQALDRPLRTITTVDRFALVEPGDDGHTMRMLQVPELKRAMGLDDEFKLPFGTRRDQIKLLGNGVCPPVMQAAILALTKRPRP